MKLLEKSPLKYSMVFGVSCLLPKAIQEQNNSKLDKALECVTKNGWIDGNECDKIKRTYLKLKENEKVKALIVDFKI